MMMSQIKTTIRFNFNPLLPPTVNLTRHKDSADRPGQENLWFVGCSTTARATLASGESETGVKSHHFLEGHLSTVINRWTGIVVSKLQPV